MSTLSLIYVLIKSFTSVFNSISLLSYPVTGSSESSYVNTPTPSPTENPNKNAINSCYVVKTIA